MKFMLKMIPFHLFLAFIIFFPGSKLFSADTVFVSHANNGMGFEQFIMDDLNSNDGQPGRVYVLESSKVYFQRIPLRLEHSCEIMGAKFNESNGGFPATIRQIPNLDGSNGFDNWPASNILTYGVDQNYKIHNLLFNGFFADGSDAATFGVLASYGEGNSIEIDHVTSVHNSVITYFNFGFEENWVLTNNTAVQYTSYPMGMWFGGFFWGGGAWTGTLESFHAQNNTIEGTWGQAFVFFDNGINGHNETGNMIHVDHNTLINIAAEPSFHRSGNNSVWTNNLFINNVSAGQTRNSSETGLSLTLSEDGHGKMHYSYQLECNQENLDPEGQDRHCWDNNNRNINYVNNGWFDTQGLIQYYGFQGEEGWCWNLTSPNGLDSLDANGNVISICDTMLSVAAQSKWLGDSTIAQFENGIFEAGNVHVTDLDFALDEMFTVRNTER